MPDIQLAVLLDGSGTINEYEWSAEINGLRDAILDPNCMPHWKVELTVIQFADDLPGGARTEVPPTIIKDSNRNSVAAGVLNITPVEGITPIHAGIDLAVVELTNSPYFSVTPRQIINIATDVGYYVVDYDATEIARDNAIAAIEHGIHQLEISAEGVGDIISSDVTWLRDSIVYPQPGSIAPPFTPGWVYKVGLDAGKLKEAICQKIAFAPAATPTPTPVPRPTYCPPCPPCPVSTPTPTPTPTPVLAQGTLHVDSDPFLFAYPGPDCDLPDALTNIGPDGLDCVVTVWGVEGSQWTSYDAASGAGGLGTYGLDTNQAYIITHTCLVCTDWEMCQ